MINKCEMRKKIINFFTKYCKNKLNKNMYHEGFYTKRNSKKVYNYLQIYFEGTILEHKCLAQKYYHIFWDNMDIPNKPFINFKKGYRTGRLKTTCKNVKWLEKSINDFQINTDFDLNVFSEIEARVKLYTYLQEIKYRQLSNDHSLLNWVLNFKKDLKISNYEKIIFFCHDNIICVCGKLKKIDKPLNINNTCGNEKCISSTISNYAKNRDLSYLREEEIIKKAQKSRSWYKHSEKTKKLISLSNKKTWTPERIKERTEKFIEDGIYKKASESIKKKILSGEYTPKTMNRLTHKKLSSEITKIKRYRSFWELEYHEKNTNLKYEFLRIGYEFEGKEKIYIVDFWDDINRIAIEIKPESMKDSPKNLAKLDSLKRWCSKNDATYKIVTEKDFCFYGK